MAPEGGSNPPVAVFRTHRWSPRVLIANSNLVGRWATWEHFRELERAGPALSVGLQGGDLRGILGEPDGLDGLDPADRIGRGKIDQVEHRRHSSHPRREGEGTTALQCAEGVLEGRPRRVAEAAVLDVGAAPGHAPARRRPAG